MLDAVPLVGRRAELLRIRTLLEASQTGLVVLRGNPGVGVTRLAAEAAHEARARGWFTREASATEASATIPFGAFAPLLACDGDLDPLAILARAPTWLHAPAGPARPLLVVDDADLLDGPSLALVHRVVAAREGAALLTIGRRRRIPTAMLGLFMTGRAVQLEIPPLPRDGLEEVVTGALDGSADAPLLHRLLHLTDGNLVLLQALLMDSLEAGSVERSEAGVWRCSAPLTIGPRLSPILEGWWQQASEADRAVLEVLSAAEPQLELQSVERLTARAQVEAAEARGHIVVVQDGRRRYVRARPALHDEAARNAVSPLRRGAVQRRLAEAVEASGARRRDDVLRVVTWRFDACEPLAADVLADAAARALSIDDLELCERLARASLGQGGGVSAAVALARALIGRQRSDAAEAVLAQLRCDTMTDAERADVAILRSTNLLRGLQRADDAGALLRQAQQTIGDTRRRLDVISTRAYVLYVAGQLAEATELSDKIISAGAAAGAGARARAFSVRAAVWAIAGLPERALASVEDALEIPRDALDRASPTTAEMLSAKWDALWYAGRLEEAEAMAAERHQVALRTHNDRERGRLLLQLGLCARARGQLQTSMRWLREAIAVTRGAYPFRLAATFAALAQAAAQLGDAAAGRHWIAQAEAAGGSVLAFDEVRLELSRAWVSYAAGLVSEARARALAAADAAARAGCTSLEVVALYDLARLGDARVAARRLLELTDRTEGVFFRALIASASALHRAAGQELDACTETFTSMGMLLLAAETAAAASVAHRRGGYPGRARASEASARKLLQRCEAARTPPIAVLADGESITSREREVATLASQGVSNREISQRLGVSVRTVENLLHRVYAKLDVQGRDELVSVLSP